MAFPVKTESELFRLGMEWGWARREKWNASDCHFFLLPFLHTHRSGPANHFLPTFVLVCLLWVKRTPDIHMGNNAPDHSQALGRPALCQGLGCIDKSLSPLEPLSPLSLTLREFSAFRHNTGTPGRGTTKNRILTFLLPEWLKDFSFY